MQKLKVKAFLKKISISKNQNSRDTRLWAGKTLWGPGAPGQEIGRGGEELLSCGEMGNTTEEVSPNLGLCGTPTSQKQRLKIYNKLLLRLRLIQSFLPQNEKEPGPLIQWQDQQYPQLMTAWVPKLTIGNLVLSWGLWGPRGSNCQTTRLGGGEHERD